MLSLLSLLNFNNPAAAAVAASHGGSSSGANGVAANGSASGSSSGPLAGLSGGSNVPLPTWKVLILDQRAQDVLATTLRVQDLRDNGVTLHM